MNRTRECTLEATGAGQGCDPRLWCRKEIGQGGGSDDDGNGASELVQDLDKLHPSKKKRK